MNSLANKLAELERRYSTAREQVRIEKARLKSAKRKEQTALTSQKLIQTAAEAVQTRAHSQIAGVVSRCLEAVFGENAYEFRIDFIQKRGKTEAKLIFIRGGNEIHPTEGSGMGQVEVASFALRLARLILSTPRRRRCLLVDEPFKSVHGDENRKRLAELILTLSKEMQVQIIMVTGLAWLRIGKIVEIS